MIAGISAINQFFGGEAIEFRVGSVFDRLDAAQAREAQKLGEQYQDNVEEARTKRAEEGRNKRADEERRASERQAQQVSNAISQRAEYDSIGQAYARQVLEQRRIEQYIANRRREYGENFETPAYQRTKETPSVSEQYGLYSTQTFADAIGQAFNALLPQSNGQVATLGGALGAATQPNNTSNTVNIGTVNISEGNYDEFVDCLLYTSPSPRD